nr:hypothetical protein CFP56_09409 [Quercus suber]
MDKNPEASWVHVPHIHDSRRYGGLGSQHVALIRPLDCFSGKREVCWRPSSTCEHAQVETGLSNGLEAGGHLCPVDRLD